MSGLNTEIYRPVDDQLYSITSQYAAVDKDSLGRISSYQNATSGGFGTLANPLNSPANEQTIIELGQGSGSKLRYGNLSLRTRMVFTDLANPAQACPTTAYAAANANKRVGGLPVCAPSWNMVGALIENVRLDINSGETTYISTSGRFLEEFTARLIRYFDGETLDNMGETLFTPCFDKTYTGSSGAGNNAVDPDNGVTETILPAQYPALDAAYVQGNVDGTIIGLNPHINPLAQGSSLAERARTYCSGNTHQREVVKIIPLNLLLPKLPDGIWKNFRKAKLTINWARTIDLLENFSTNAAGAQGCVRLVGCDLISDYYVMTPGQASASLSEKTSVSPLDILPFYNTQAYVKTYTPGADITIPAVRQFDSIMVMQVARGFGNGQAGANNRAYTSHGQFLLFGNSAANNGLLKLRADEPVGQPAGSVAGISSVQLVVGSRVYPDNPIICSKSTNGTICFEPSHLYHEYLKGIAKLGRRNGRPAISYDTFRTNCPFIYLRPWSDNAAHLSNEGQDITIRMMGGVESQIVIILFTLRVLSLSGDGSSKAW